MPPRAASGIKHHGGVHHEWVQRRAVDRHIGAPYPGSLGIACAPCRPGSRRSSPTDYTDDLRLAHVLADDADSITTTRFKALDLHVMSKPDLTPVTDGDHAVEESIRRTLSRARSRDAVLGEEQGTTGHSQRRWIVDPIDGTKNFVRGVPVWATLIALEVDDEVVLAVVSAPQLHRRWWASAGNGAWTGRSLLKATRSRSPTYAASRTPRSPTPRCTAGTSAAGSTTSCR